MADFAEPIAHVDMDAFFVEVERLRRPELRGVAVVVGGLSGRGVVASASYEARRRGVHSGMPMTQAQKLCPHARFIPPDHGEYRHASNQVFTVLRSFTPLVEALSLDEAFLDVAGLRLHFRDPVAVGEEIRGRIRAETGLPASVGIATNKLLAKLASREAKPDGLFRIGAGSELEFLHPLPVRALWGVGEATYAALEALGIETISDLAEFPRSTLERRLGASLGASLWELARGRDARPVEPDAAAKSISVEQTYASDLSQSGAIEAELLRHADRLARRLRRSELAAWTVTLKVRFADFTTVTRSQTLQTPSDTGPDLYAAARALLSRVRLERRRVRLLGLAASGLTGADTPRQLLLERPPWEELADAVDRIRDRFGDEAVRPARLVEPPGAER
ncbi:MAG: DNA polymerase IV [Acidimicrobiia bacterium]